MKTCPSCKRQLADDAAACPQCGKRFTSQLTIIIAIVVAALAVAYVVGKPLMDRDRQRIEAGDPP